MLFVKTKSSFRKVMVFSTTQLKPKRLLSGPVKLTNFLNYQLLLNLAPRNSTVNSLGTYSHHFLYRLSLCAWSGITLPKRRLVAKKAPVGSYLNLL